MKNILVPTDFTTDSVRMTMRLLTGLNEKANVIFFHAFHHPFFYNDFIRSAPPYASLMTEELRISCRQLKEQFPESVGSVTFLFMKGDTASLFRNFLEANAIDAIACPEDYSFRKVHKDSVNPIPLFKRAGKPLMQNSSLTHRLDKMVVNKKRLEYSFDTEVTYN